MVGQFQSAIGSAPLRVEEKRKYITMLVKIKAIVAIFEHAFCVAIDQDVLQVIERKFGQPQALMTGHLETMCKHLKLNMLIFKHIIEYCNTISRLVGDNQQAT